MIKNLLFDIDDTFIDDSKGWKTLGNWILIPELSKHGSFKKKDYLNAMNSISENYGLGKLPTNIHPFLITLRHVNEELHLNLKENEMAEIQKKVDKFIRKNEVLFDKFDTLIKKLSANYSIYILTNRNFEHAVDSLDKFALREYINAIYAPDREGTHKLDGEMFTELLTKEKLKADECLMIGDSLVFDGACLKAGIAFCLVDRVNKGATLRFGYYRITNLNQLPKLIEAINELRN